MEFRRMAVARMSQQRQHFRAGGGTRDRPRSYVSVEGSAGSDPCRLRQPGGQTPEDPRDAKLREENGCLKRALAEKGLEVDFFKGALQKIAARRQRNTDSGARASTTRSGK